MRDIVTFDKVYKFAGDQKKYRATIRLPFGWSIEADAVMYDRWRLFVAGGGIHWGEPWGYDGKLWAVNLRVYVFGLSLGLRGVPPELPPTGWEDDEDAEAPRDA